MSVMYVRFVLKQVYNPSSSHMSASVTERHDIYIARRSGPLRRAPASAARQMTLDILGGYRCYAASAIYARMAAG